MSPQICLYTHEMQHQITEFNLEKMWKSLQRKHSIVGQIDMFWQCIIHHLNILINNYATKEKARKQTNWNQKQNTFRLKASKWLKM